MQKSQIKVKVNQTNLIKSQIVFYVFVAKSDFLIERDVNILIELGIVGKVSLADFCSVLGSTEVETNDIKQITSKVQLYRNRITSLVKKGYIVKEGKEIKLSPAFNVVKPEGDVLLEYSLLYLESKNV